MGLAVRVLDDSGIEDAYEVLSTIVEERYQVALRPYRTKVSRGSKSERSVDGP
jgi:hypothetical protein